MEQNGKGLSRVNEYYSQYGLRAKELHAGGKKIIGYLELKLKKE